VDTSWPEKERTMNKLALDHDLHLVKRNGVACQHLWVRATNGMLWLPHASMNMEVVTSRKSNLSAGV